MLAQKPHGNVNMVIIGKLLMIISGGGHGCLWCANQIPKTPEDYDVAARERGFQWLGPRVPNTQTKTKWKCGSGHVWEARYADIKHVKSGCPTCKARAFGERSRAMWASGHFDGVFKSPTSIELAIAAALNALGVEHTSRFRPDDYNRPYDEFVPPNVLIEIQGDFWHANPLFYADKELYEAQQRNQHRDVEKAAWASDHGYYLIVIWQNEINEHGAEHLVKERILPLLGN